MRYVINLEGPGVATEKGQSSSQFPRRVILKNVLTIRQLHSSAVLLRSCLKSCLLGLSVKSLSHVQLCDPMDCSTPGFPVHDQLLEPTQTHVHRIGDAIQPSHPLLSPSPPTFNLSQHQGNESVLHIRWPKDWSFSFSISPSNEYSRTDLI